MMKSNEIRSPVAGVRTAEVDDVGLLVIHQPVSRLVVPVGESQRDDARAQSPDFVVQPCKLLTTE